MMMRLDQALVAQKLCESRQEAQELIKEGYVFVDGECVKKQTKQVGQDVAITITQHRKFVSRGGNKLEGALLNVFNDKDTVEAILKGTRAIDIGSSTGGFTDCLLTYGVSEVTAVDVGSSQLHQKLRNDTRVHCFENTDIRTFTSLTSFEIIVADLSFIALEKLFDTIISFGKPGSRYFLLIKPQFEVGKGNTKKGIVRDITLVTDVLAKYEAYMTKKQFQNIRTFPSSIQGGDGNQEYFLYGEQSE